VLHIPHPTQGKLYVKLRDDPAVISVAVLDVKTPPSASTDGMPPSGTAIHSTTEPSTPPASVAAKNLPAHVPP